MLAGRLGASFGGAPRDGGWPASRVDNVPPKGLFFSGDAGPAGDRVDQQVHGRHDLPRGRGVRPGGTSVGVGHVVLTLVGRRHEPAPAPGQRDKLANALGRVVRQPARSASTSSRCSSRTVKAQRSAFGERATTSDRCCRVAASTRSTPSSRPAVSCRAAKTASPPPSARSSAAASDVMPLPTSARTPAEPTSTRSLCSPRRSASRALSSPSVKGDRHTLPVHTTRMCAGPLTSGDQEPQRDVSHHAGGRQRSQGEGQPGGR